MRGAFVTVQLALSVALLINATLLLESAARIAQADPGFDAAGLSAVAISLPDNYEAPAETSDFFTRFVERAEALSGVRAAGAISDVPFGGVSFTGPYELLDGGAVESTRREAAYRYVLGDYFGAMDIKVVEGRTFESTDGTNVVIIDESLARAAWPDRSALGKRLRVSPWTTEDAVVVGVVRSVLHHSARAPAEQTIYVPFQPWPWSNPRLSVVLRSQREAAELVSELRAVLSTLDPGIPLERPVQFESAIRRADAPTFLALALVGGFAALALLMASVGLYGVLAYSVASEGPEIGIRLSLGASVRSVLVGVAARSGAHLALGAALGTGLGLLVAPLVRGLLFQDASLRSSTLAMILGVLFAVGALATWVPARRAAAVDPAVALRGM